MEYSSTKINPRLFGRSQSKPITPLVTETNNIYLNAGTENYAFKHGDAMCLDIRSHVVIQMMAYDKDYQL